MASSWRDEYKQALQERDERERASYRVIDDELIAAFTSLLDRTSALEAENAALLSANSPKPSISPTPSAKARDKSRDSATPSNDPSIAQLRADLTESLRANGQLQARTKNAEAELSKLKVQSKNEGKQVEALTRERALLRQKVKDRDDELREKAKLLDNVHDDVLTVEMERNMYEQKVKQLQAENKELIDRWLASKGREAEEMNVRLENRDRGNNKNK